MAKKIIDHQDNVMTVSILAIDDFNELEEKIKDSNSNVLSSSFEIGQALKIIKEKKYYEFYSFNDIYEYALSRFGYHDTSVKNLIGLYEKYRTDRDELDDRFKDYTLSALTELSSIDKEEILEKFPSSMTIKAIRNQKKFGQLTDSLKIFAEEYKTLLNRINSICDSMWPGFPRKYKFIVSGEFNLNEDGTVIDRCKITIHHSFTAYREITIGSYWHFDDEDLDQFNKFKDMTDEDIKKYIDEFFFETKRDVERDIEKQKKNKDLIKKPKYPKDCNYWDINSKAFNIFLQLLELFGLNNYQVKITQTSQFDYEISVTDDVKFSFRNELQKEIYRYKDNEFVFNYLSDEVVAFISWCMNLLNSTGLKVSKHNIDDSDEEDNDCDCDNEVDE